MTRNSKNRRIAKRVGFDHEAIVMLVDRTWSCKARLSDISQSGAKLRIYGESHERMKSEEFFLVITPDAKVRRRAKVIWEAKSNVGVRFITSLPD
jgi:hypothetical protein